VKDKEVSNTFLAGGLVFQIHTFSQGLLKDKGIVVTKEEYHKLLDSHDYLSILHIAPLHYRLAYLYGCLNMEKGVPRKETFIFYYREIGKRIWKEWFS